MVRFENNESSQKNNAPVSYRIFTDIQKLIISSKLKSGYKLTEQDICEKYKVSRTPVREALRQLEAEGLIENVPNRGAFVIGFTDRDLDDIYELRRSYELLAVKWAIERITDEELEDLEETFEFMEFYTAKEDVPKMKNINAGFHQLIYKASGNKMIEKILSSYQMYIKYSKKYNDDFQEDLTESLKEHEAIFQAFKNKDVIAGMNAMDKHIVASAKRCGINIK